VGFVLAAWRVGCHKAACEFEGQLFCKQILTFLSAYPVSISSYQSCGHKSAYDNVVFPTKAKMLQIKVEAKLFPSNVGLSEKRDIYRSLLGCVMYLNL